MALIRHRATRQYWLNVYAGEPGEPVETFHYDREDDAIAEIDHFDGYLHTIHVREDILGKWHSSVSDRSDDLARTIRDADRERDHRRIEMAMARR